MKHEVIILLFMLPLGRHHLEVATRDKLSTGVNITDNPVGAESNTGVIFNHCMPSVRCTFSRCSTQYLVTIVQLLNYSNLLLHGLVAERTGYNHQGLRKQLNSRLTA